MPHYLNLCVVLHYDLIITYLAVMFFIYWILGKIRIWRLGHALQRVFRINHRESTAAILPYVRTAAFDCPGQDLAKEFGEIYLPDYYEGL